MTAGDGPSLAEAVSEATAVLAAAGVPSPRVDAELLAEHLLGVGLGRLRALMLGDSPAPEGYADLVAERAQRIPLQHITGVAHFRYLELAVGPGVFIPRPETESVVQLVLDWLSARNGCRAWRTPKSWTWAPGPAPSPGRSRTRFPARKSTRWSSANSRMPGRRKTWLPLGVHLIRGDLRDALAEHNGTFDVVVSNPPYIPAEAIPNEPEVALHDPPEALYGGGADGMELPTAAAASAARLLVPGGYFVMEHAEVQSEWIAAMLKRTGLFAEVTTHRDLNGKDRATSAVLAPSGPTPANNRVTSDERIGQ